MMENWVVKDCADEVSQWIIRLMPFLKVFHNKFHDPVFIDLARVHLLFDKDGPIKSVWDSTNSIWTEDNPLPINVIGNHQEIIELWDIHGQNSEITFQQSKDQAQWLLNIAKNNRDVMFIVCQNKTDISCYLIQKCTTLKGKNYLLTMYPNSTIYHYCRCCGRRLYNNTACGRCAPPTFNTIKKDGDLSLNGTFYCDVACQTEDWPRHKQHCVAEK